MTFVPAYVPEPDPFDYDEYLRSPRWHTLRERCKRRDGWQCCTCENLAGLPLHAHHRSYRHRGEPGAKGMRAELADLITLCEQCHERIHG